MRINTTSSILLIVLFLTAQFYSPASTANNIGKNICEYVAADNKKRLRSFLKTQHIKIRSIFGDVTCNGKNILLFAAARQSEKVGKMIIKKLPKKTLLLLIDELTTASANLGAIARERAG
jgi:hypothetical protein